MLELKNITKTYTPKKGVPVQALRGVDLSFEDRGMVFILGKSGSGKSTLLNIIGGLDSADGGEIIIDGKSTKGFKEADYDNYRNTYVGFVFQEYNILNDFTVGENISLAVELQNGKVSKERVDEILKEVGLEGYADRKPNELSGGQKQRVAIARALIKSPEIIMADEPTGALDSETGRSIFELLKKLSEDKLVVVVSHDREFAEEYGDRIIELSDGEVIADKVNREIKGERKEREDKEIKKARLPYKRALAMGAKSLTKKRLRLAITIILCFVSFAAFGFADVIVERNKVVVGAEALYENGDNYVSFRQSYGEFQQETVVVSQKTLEELIGESGLNFKGVKCESSILPLLENHFNLSAYYIDEYIYFPASEELFEEAGFDLYGRLPANDKEAVITKYIYDQFREYGMYYFEGEEKKILSSQDVGDIESFLSKGINFDGREIVGIADTHADPNGKLTWLKDIENPFSSEVENIRQNYFLYSYHSMVFIDENVYEKDYAVKQEIDDTGFGKRVSCGIYTLTNFKGSAPESSIKYAEEILWLDGKGDRKELGENEIVVGINVAKELWPRLDYDIECNIPSGYNKLFFEGKVPFEGISLGEFRNVGAFFAACCMEAEDISVEELEIYRQYCIERGKAFDQNAYYFPDNITLNDSDFIMQCRNPETLTENQLRLSYACYLCYERDDIATFESGLINNVTGRISGKEIKDRYADRVFVENRLENAAESMDCVAEDDYYIYFYNSGKLIDEVGFTTPPTIVGIYIPSEGYPDDYVINDKIYEQSKYYENGIYDFVIAPLPHDLDIMKIIAEINYDKSNRINLTCINLSFTAIINMQNAMTTIQPYVSWGSAILGIFCLLLLGNYIGYSITSRKKEIGILRAMGAKRSDVFAIFINEGVIITAIVLVMAVIGVIAMCAGLNTLIPVSYGITIKLLKVSIRQILLMILVAYSATLLASAIPLYKMAKKKPVDIIQNK